MTKPNATAATEGLKPPSVPTEIHVGLIDIGPALKGRAKLDEEAVERYAETEAEWGSDQPITLFHGGKYFAGDGAHRVTAKRKNKTVKILAVVYRCESDADAESRAERYAISGVGNRRHGLHRSNDDKRKAVREALLKPQNADLSDREIGDDWCGGVHHTTVAAVRIELTNKGLLTGRAASTSPHRGYKDGAKIRGGSHREGSGKVVVNQAPEAPTEPGVTAGYLASPTTGEDAGYLASPEPTAPTDGPTAKPPAEPAGGSPSPETNVPSPAPIRTDKPPEVMRDARGRVIPEPLRLQYAQGRECLKEVRAIHATAMKVLSALAAEPGGAGVKVMLHNLELDYKKIAKEVSHGIFYVCCPYVDHTGGHPLGGACKACGTVGSRGWLTRHQWETLSDPIKKLIDQYVTGPVAEDDEPAHTAEQATPAAPVDVQPARPKVRFASTDKRGVA